MVGRWWGFLNSIFGREKGREGEREGNGGYWGEGIEERR